jgi:hypothetical protein
MWAALTNQAMGGDQAMTAKREEEERKLWMEEMRLHHEWEREGVEQQASMFKIEIKISCVWGPKNHMQA